MAKKTTCPITREQFRHKAKPLTIVIDGKDQEAEVKEFSTGSLGWYLNVKLSVEIDGVRVPVQVGMNLTIVGSKELPQDSPPPSSSPAPSSSAAPEESE